MRKKWISRALIFIILFSINIAFHETTYATESYSGIDVSSGHSFPVNIVMGPDGKLYVSEYLENKIIQMDKDGENKTSFVTGLNQPIGMVFDGSGNLYVAEYDGRKVSKIAPYGGMTIVKSDLPGILAGIVINSSGEIFVVDYTFGKIYKMDADGNNFSEFVTDLQATSLMGMTIDTSDNMYISDITNGKIIKIAPNATVSDFITNVTNPRWVTLGKDGYFYISTGSRTIVKADSTGTIVETFSTGTLSPWGANVDAAGYIYFTDTSASTKKIVGSASTIDTTHISLVMNTSLEGAQADPAAFTISGVALAPQVTGAEVSGQRIDLTLSEAMTVLDSNIKVAYTKTGTNNLVTSVGSVELDNFNGLRATNTLLQDQAAPTGLTVPAYVAPSSGGSGGGGGGSSAPASSGADIIVNGQTQTAGTSASTTKNGQTVTTITVDTTKLQAILDAQDNHASVTIPVTSNSDVAIAGLTGQMVKNMETKEATLEVKTSSETYTLPASEIDIDAVSKQLGQDVKLSDIKVQIIIAEPSAASVKVVESAAKAGAFTIMVPAVEFEINCTYSGKTVDVRSFNSYVERTVAIPDGVDPTKITTGVVVSPDGKVRQVPTQIIQVSGKYFAKINSLTNSTYAVIWNPITFADVANHWAKDAVNNMGSRMIVTGVGNGNYNPNKDITRAEFAAIIVRALGLEAGTGENKFSDVKAANWYCGYVGTASKYGIINGYNETTFAPNDKITREQAMAMISRAMKITGLEPTLTDSEMSTLLTGYTDATGAASYAKSSIASCLKTGVVSGTSSNTLAPKNNITRAEVSVIVERLLKKSELI